MRRSRLGWNVVALGARDYYEAAVGLEKAGLLDRLYTDFYTPDRLRNFAPTRFNEALPSCKTRSLWVIAVPFAIVFRLRLPKQLRHTLHMRFDYLFGFCCAALIYLFGSRRALVYSYYMEGFVGFHRLTKTRPAALICFQVHPSPKYVQYVLARDAEAFRGTGDLAFVQDQETLYDRARLEQYDRALAFADHIICASRITQKSLGRQVRAPVSVVPYGSRFTHSSSEMRAQSERPKIRLVSVCQVVQRKGLHWAFHAMQQLPRDIQQKFEWHVIGRVIDGGICKLAPDNVRFISFLSRDELAGEMGSADLFIMPSIVEGFGLVFIEALSMGTPVLYTRATGAADFCVSDYHGFLVEPSDWRSIRDLFDMIANEPEKLRTMRSSCQAVAGSLTWDRFHEGIVAAIRGIP